MWPLAIHTRFKATPNGMVGQIPDHHRQAAIMDMLRALGISACQQQVMCPHDPVDAPVVDRRQTFLTPLPVQDRSDPAIAVGWTLGDQGGNAW